jgi:hypothetical protein
MGYLWYSLFITAKLEVFAMDCRRRSELVLLHMGQIDACDKFYEKHPEKATSSPRMVP